MDGIDSLYTMRKRKEEAARIKRSLRYWQIAENTLWSILGHLVALWLVVQL